MGRVVANLKDVPISLLFMGIPWWACLNRHCSSHDSAKRRNGVWPVLPVVTIRNAQKCPCLREGCECSWSQEHPFHRGMIPKKLCPCKKHEEAVIRKVDQGIGQQLSVMVTINGRKIPAVTTQPLGSILEAKPLHQGQKTRILGRGSQSCSHLYSTLPVPSHLR